MKIDLINQKESVIEYINICNNYRLQSIDVKNIECNPILKRISLDMVGNSISIPFDYKHYNVFLRTLKIIKLVKNKCGYNN